MRFRSPIFSACILALAVSGPAGLQAQVTAYYADVHSMGVDAEVRVNGSRIFNAAEPGGLSHSLFLTPLLVKGKNRVEVVARIPEDADGDPNSTWVQCDIAAAPADKQRTEQDPGRMLVQRRIEPLNRLMLPGKLPAEAYEVPTGRMDAGTGPLRFGPLGERRWGWGIHLKDTEQVLSGIPASLTVSGQLQTLARAEIHFIDSTGPARVAFGGLQLPKGGGVIDLPRSAVSEGLAYLGHERFDTVWIFGFSAAGVEKVEIMALQFTSDRRLVRSTDEFQVDLPFSWSWEKAEVVKDIATDGKLRASAVDFLRELHTAVDSAAPEEWSPFFEAKLTDLAKAMGQPEDQLRQGQLQFFSSLKATPGWKLEPFDPARLRLVPVNDRLLEVSYIDSAGPVISVPLVKPGSEKPDRFTMPLTIARIGGKWTVTR